MPAEFDYAPIGRYRRALEGADISLEANTKDAPKKDSYYVFRSGKVVCTTKDFGEAVETYKGLCRGYWEERLKSEDPQERLAAAWGLVGIDPNHKEAGTVLQEEGDDAARKRLAQLRRQRWAARRKRGSGAFAAR